MSELPCRTELVERAKEYWDREDSANPAQGLHRYINELLPDEMEYAHSKNRIRTEPCDELVLLVGHSIEPLLQTVWAYRPKKRVLLIVSESYGRDKDGAVWYGQEQAQLVKAMIEHLKKNPQIALPDDLKIDWKLVSEPDPVQVFQTLLQNVGQSRNVVVDITGAKKSMVSGAFLYAAYANVPVSYVDFEDDAYDPERRRPYGCGCIIEPFDNPYEEFALRDWEYISTLYKRYKFQDALDLLVGGLSDIPDVMKKMRKYLQDSVQAIEKLARILECYAAWEAGNYNEAHKIGQTLEGFQVPIGIQILGQDRGWITLDGNEIHLPKGFYAHSVKVESYVRDEYARIERLVDINHDYRSAFLRSAGLNEILLKKRLVDSIEGDRLEVIADQVRFDPRLSAWRLFQTFERGGTLDPDYPGVRARAMRKWWSAAHNPEIRMDNFFGAENGWHKFLDTRNKLTILMHRYHVNGPLMHWLLFVPMSLTSWLVWI
jgi:hypothetical protein